MSSSRSARWALHLVAAVLLAVAAGLVLPGGPAAAAGCPSAHGVTVVVDFHELGGGVQSACVADGGGWTAGDLFPAAGFPLDRVQSQPGFVCRVSGKPSDGDACSHTPPADAYWGLWWSDGTSGSWSYATSGADSQHVPEGGYVAFSWNGSTDRSAPGYRPAPHPSASPSPTHSPTHSASPTRAPSQTPTHDPAQPASSAPAAGGTGSASATPTAAATGSPTRAPTGKTRPRKPKATDTSSPTGSASAVPSPSASASAVVADPAGPAGPGGGGLPGWVAPVVIAALFGTAATVAVVRRRRSPA